MLRLEADRAQTELPLFAAAAPLTPTPASSPSPAPASALKTRLMQIDPDRLTPREALELLYELRQLAHRDS
jgi:DNA mismatch repair protein MutS